MTAHSGRVGLASELTSRGASTAAVMGSPWENGYGESFNGTLRDELLDREIFYTLTEATVLIGRRRREYNTVRPHSALGYRPPAPEAVRPVSIGGFNGFNMSAVLS